MFLARTRKAMFSELTGSSGKADVASSSDADSAADDEAKEKPSAIDDPISDWEARYRFERHRLKEDCLETRELIDNLRHECTIPNCPSRGKVGKGEHSCEHTFASELWPDAMDACTKCGIVLFFNGADWFAGGKDMSMLLLPDDATLYTQTRIITGIKIHVLKCKSAQCGVTFYPHPWKHGTYCGL